MLGNLLMRKDSSALFTIAKLERLGSSLLINVLKLEETMVKYFRVMSYLGVKVHYYDWQAIRSNLSIGPKLFSSSLFVDILLRYS